MRRGPKFKKFGENSCGRNTMLKELSLIPIVGLLVNTERGGESILLSFYYFNHFLNLSLKTHNKKNTHNTILTWKPNRVNNQYVLLLQNCYLQIVFPTTTDKDGITPYLLAATGRRLGTHFLPANTERIL